MHPHLDSFEPDKNVNLGGKLPFELQLLCSILFDLTNAFTTCANEKVPFKQIMSIREWPDGSAWKTILCLASNGSDSARRSLHLYSFLVTSNMRVTTMMPHVYFRHQCQRLLCQNEMASYLIRAVSSELFARSFVTRIRMMLTRKPRLI